MVSLRVKEVFCLFYALCLFLSGILLIGFSLVLSYKLFYHYKFIPSGCVGPFILLLLLGFIHLFLTWLAVKGPTREHDVHIILFMLITFALLLAECAIGVWNIVIWDEIDVETLLLMSESFKTIITEDFNKSSEWNKLQSKLKCCGLNGIGDYKTTKGLFPVSCCEEQIGPNVTCYEESCRLPLARYVKNILINGAIISFVSFMFQGFGVFIFYSFYQSLRKDRSEKLARRSALQRDLVENQDTAIPLSMPSIPSAPQVYFENQESKSYEESNRRSKGLASKSPSTNVE